MRQRKFMIRTPLLILSLVVFCLHCPKKKEEIIPPAPPPPPAEVTKPAPEPEPPKKEVTDAFPSQPVEAAPIPEPSIDELNRKGVLKAVYFAFDSYELDAEARSRLQENARWLKENSTYSLRIEGHCDERGTIEYNLALGERRASAVRDYVVGLGVRAARVRIVSYGEERPADPRHNEAAWSKNRRAEFLLES